MSGATQDTPADTIFQFYYTSCERGLAGHQGYQFNAATPGAPVVLVREVEPLLAYEPPAALLRAQSAEELARCPVNLCYVPGSVTTIANIEYVGRDYSRRPGNFFAHALAADAGDDAIGRMLGPLLPVELWRAPLWQRIESPSTELLPFDAEARRGPVTTASADAFLAAHPRRAELPQLATAALLAATERGRSVLIVDRDSDAVAYWIAAVCYLLPSPLARRISFATYLSRPSRSALHVLGAVPEAGADLGKGATELFELFDFTNDRISAIQPDPFIEWLSSLRLRAARTVWNLAAALATGAEQTLAEWRPIGFAGAALGTRLNPKQLDELFEWLARIPDRVAQRPDDELRDAVRTLGRGLLDQRLGEKHLPTLLGIAQASGNSELYGVALQRWFDAAIDLVTRADPNAPAPMPIGSEATRGRLAESLLARLEQAQAPQALRLLDWARGTGLPVPDEALNYIADGVLANWLLDTPVGEQEEVGGQLRDVLEYWPTLRAAVIHALAIVVEEVPAAADRAFSGPLRRIITEEHLAGRPMLIEARQIGGTANRPTQKLNVLLALLKRRGEDLPDSELLNRFWNGGWNLAQAAEAAGSLPLERILDRGVANWFVRALIPNLVFAGAPERNIELYLELARQLSRAGILERLGESGEDIVTTLDFALSLDAAVDYEKLIRLLDAYGQTANPVRLWLVDNRLLPALVRLDLTANNVESIMRRLTPETAGTFLDRLSARLIASKGQQDPQILAGLLLANGSAAQQHQPMINAIIEKALRARGKRGTEAVARILTDQHKGYLAADLPGHGGRQKFGRWQHKEAADAKAGDGRDTAEE